MPLVHSFHRYESGACFDREDAEALSKHVRALAVELARQAGRLILRQENHSLGLHFARLVRITQRATQAEHEGKAFCHDVERLILTITNGKRRIIIRTTRADITAELDNGPVRIVELAERDSNAERVHPHLPRMHSSSRKSRHRRRAGRRDEHQQETGRS